jgi:class 3 adenylate cyclase/predicted Ser/Thr protein kinase
MSDRPSPHRDDAAEARAPSNSEKVAAQPRADLLADTIELASSKNSQVCTGSIATNDELAPSAPSAQSSLHTVGRYEFVRHLGDGGSGQVFLAFDPQLQRRVAIKVPKLQINDATRESFLVEARRLAQLSHPGIVVVHDVRVEDDRCFIISEFVDGTSLKECLKTRQLTWQEAITIAEKVAVALAYAHAHRTIHRDIKPANIMLKEDLVPVIVDFGSALSDASTPAKERGLVIGTLSYMAPEQTRGEAHRVDGRTDIYALGAMLYQMVCGRRPFVASDASEFIRQICHDEPQPPRQLVSDIPKDLESIILKAMAKHPADRYTTAADMASDLRAVLEMHADTAHVPIAVRLPIEQKTASESASTRRRVREAERRQVTVLCCVCEDLDSPAFFALDAEQQHDLLQEFRRICEEQLARFGGVIAQATGGMLVLCFGYPIAYEDAARRAVYTGLALRDNVPRLQALLHGNFNLALRQAIHTGVVVASERTSSAGGELMSIVGEARIVAARLAAIADPDTLLITGSAYQLVRNNFQCASRGRQNVDGAAAPLDLFCVLQETTRETGSPEMEPSGLTPLVGRETELSVLRNRWEQAVDGLGQVVALVGEPGLGKSRLVRELREAVANSLANEQSAVIVEWHGSPYYINSEWHPLTTWLQRRFEFQNDTNQIIHRLRRFLQIKLRVVGP